MGFFFKKPSVRITDFCEKFYEEWVFNPQVRNQNLAEVYSRTAYKLIGEADPSFNSVNFEMFHSEVLAVRLEMIGLAWTYRLKDSIAVAQSEFTKQYLFNTGKAHLWDKMLEYNHAIAQSAIHGLDTNSRTGRGRIVFINNFRFNLFEDYEKKGVDHEAAARVINRLFSNQNWKIGKTQIMVAMKMTRKLDHDGSEAIWFRLGSFAHGFYQGATEALSEVKIIA